MNGTTKEEFLAAYERYAEPIYRHCYFRVSSASQAEDLVQETFTKVWQYLSEGKPVENMRAFLYRVATNLIIDQSRRRREVSLEALQEADGSFQPSTDGHRVVEKKVLMSEVHAALGLLREDEREILVMRYIDDLGPQEIAEVLGTSANNVSVRLNRAVKALRAHLNPT